MKAMASSSGDPRGLNHPNSARIQALVLYQFGVEANVFFDLRKPMACKRVNQRKNSRFTAAMKNARYQFFLWVQHWTLEHSKKVVWKDETSIVLGAQWGSIRVWRAPNEKLKPSVIRSRWKSLKKGGKAKLFWTEPTSWNQSWKQQWPEGRKAYINSFSGGKCIAFYLVAGYGMKSVAVDQDLATVSDALRCALGENRLIDKK